MNLPSPRRRLGYDWAEVQKILRSHGYRDEQFTRWHVGQTGAIAEDGRLLYYRSDVEDFLAGRKPAD